MFRFILAALGLAALLGATVARAGDASALRGPLSGVVKALAAVELDASQSTRLDTLIATLPKRGEGHGKPSAGGGNGSVPGKGRGGKHRAAASASERPDGDEARPEASAMSDDAHRAIRQAHRALMLQQVRSDAMEAEAIHAMVDGGRHGEAPAEVHTAVDQMVALHAALTPEQRAAWATAFESRVTAHADGGQGMKAQGMEKGKGKHRRHRRGQRQPEATESAEE